MLPSYCNKLQDLTASLIITIILSSDEHELYFEISATTEMWFEKFVVSIGDKVADTVTYH